MVTEPEKRGATIRAARLRGAPPRVGPLPLPVLALPPGPRALPAPGGPLLEGGGRVRQGRLRWRLGGGDARPPARAASTQATANSELPRTLPEAPASLLQDQYARRLWQVVTDKVTGGARNRYNALGPARRILPLCLCPPTSSVCRLAGSYLMCGPGRPSARARPAPPPAPAAAGPLH